MTPNTLQAALAALAVLASVVLALAGAVDGTEALAIVGTSLGYIFGASTAVARVQRDSSERR